MNKQNFRILIADDDETVQKVVRSFGRPCLPTESGMQRTNRENGRTTGDLLLLPDRNDRDPIPPLLSKNLIY
jgi:hypothetical protein